MDIDARPTTVELQLAPRPPPAPPTPPVVFQAHTQPTAGGERWVWRGVTSFRIAHQFAIGDTAGARAALDQAHAFGFNVVRVLSTAFFLFDLAPEVGRAVLPQVFQEAAERGIYVHVVAIADSAPRGYDWRDHARKVAELCAAADNCLYEFANEPSHSTQVGDIHDPANTQREAEAAVAGLDALQHRWTAGPAPNDEGALPTGAFAVRHLDRGRDILNQARHIKDLFESVENQTDGLYAVSSEPMGADERPPSHGEECVAPGPHRGECEVPGRQRWWQPQFFMAIGALQAGWGGGGTFHCQSCLQSSTFGPHEAELAKRWRQSTTLVPDGEWGTWRFSHNGHTGSPTLNPGGDRIFEECNQEPCGPIVRAFSFMAPDDREGFTVVLHRPADYPDGLLQWGGDGWQPAGVILSAPQITVFRIQKE